VTTRKARKVSPCKAPYLFRCPWPPEQPNLPQRRVSKPCRGGASQGLPGTQSGLRVPNWRRNLLRGAVGHPRDPVAWATRVLADRYFGEQATDVSAPTFLNWY
jgi:hypothetical protein